MTAPKPLTERETDTGAGAEAEAETETAESVGTYNAKLLLSVVGIDGQCPLRVDEAMGGIACGRR